MGGSDYEEAVLRLLDIASLTQRMPQAEAALAQLDQPLTRSRQQLWQESRKTVLVMGISPFSHGCDRYPVETQSGTLGSVLQEFTHFPWSKPHAYQGEPGITYLSKQQIAQVNPDVVFVQSYGGGRSLESSQYRCWRSLKAVRTQQVFEMPQLWHWGNGTRLLRLTLQRLLPLIDPSMVDSDSSSSRPVSGLRQRELCDRFGWNYREVAQAARQLGLTTHDYLPQKTGWRRQDELYYPPDEPSA
ncbi:MAG: hypothetical protein AAGG53_16090 [Cyanobacteria bacterium P01_H01_bin.152]